MNIYDLPGRFIKSVEKIVTGDGTNTVYQITTSTEILRDAGSYLCMEQIIKSLADKYVEDFGDEILKQIQQKTIEQKVIQKVIENLRKELKTPTSKG